MNGPNMMPGRVAPRWGKGASRTVKIPGARKPKKPWSWDVFPGGFTDAMRKARLDPVYEAELLREINSRKT
jgi:hypothetical protein